MSKQRNASELDINDIDSYFYHDMLQYNTLDLTAAVSAVDAALASFNIIRGLRNDLMSIGIEDLEGESVKLILELFNAIPGYIDEFHHTMNDYSYMLKRANRFMASIEESTYIRVLENL